MEGHYKDIWEVKAFKIVDSRRFGGGKNRYLKWSNITTHPHINEQEYFAMKIHVEKGHDKEVQIECRSIGLKRGNNKS